MVLDSVTKREGNLYDVVLPKGGDYTVRVLNPEMDPYEEEIYFSPGDEDPIVIRFN